MVQVQIPAPQAKGVVANGSFYDLYKQVAGPLLKAMGDAELA